jgi:hypothetical protein
VTCPWSLKDHGKLPSGGYHSLTWLMPHHSVGSSESHSSSTPPVLSFSEGCAEMFRGDGGRGGGYNLDLSSVTVPFEDSHCPFMRGWQLHTRQRVMTGTYTASFLALNMTSTNTYFSSLLETFVTVEQIPPHRYISLTIKCCNTDNYGIPIGKKQTTPFTEREDPSLYL